jgi:hypothetical protein
MTEEMLVDGSATTTAEPTGPVFARALAVRDFDTLQSTLDADVEFRALTPRRTWEANGDAGTVGLFRGWFDEETVVDEIEEVVTHPVGDRQHLAYRFRGHDADGPFVVEQQIYFTERNGRIGWMRMMCSGFQRR